MIDLRAPASNAYALTVKNTACHIGVYVILLY